MKKINETVSKQARPVKVLQFGEGNFLRGFVDHMIDTANEEGLMDAGIVMVKPRKGHLNPAFANQDCIYTVSLRGLTDNGPKTADRIITSVIDAVSCYDDYELYMKYALDDDLRFIVSNTTEAGIVFEKTDRFDMCPPESYPGKLTKLLYERYKHFDGDKDKGLIILPVELIDDNAHILKDCIKKLSFMWKLEDGFNMWIDEACIFCNTLVDRIISGNPAGEAEELFAKWGYSDDLIVCGELFGLWVIEGDERVEKELPLDKASLPVMFVKDIKPYKKRKVRILNGAHTGFSLLAYLKGHDTVLDAMEDKQVYDFVNKLLYEEVIPTIDLDRDELEDFAKEVISRFKNPYIRHELSSIALNSVSKWRTRLLPTMLDHIKNTESLPDHIVISLAGLLLYYRGQTDEEGVFTGNRYRNGVHEVYEIKDSKKVLSFLEEHEEDDSRTYVESMLSNDKFWGMDLLTVEGLCEAVTDIYLRLEKSVAGNV